MSFTILTKQTEFLENVILKDFDEVLENVAMFDLIEPFKIFNDKNEDKTTEFMDFAKNKNYKFVDKKEILKLLPDKLKKIMKKNFQKIIPYEKANIKFVYPDDIKSLSGFYELWDEGKIAIGNLANDKSVLLYFDTKEKKTFIRNKEENLFLDILGEQL